MNPSLDDIEASLLCAPDVEDCVVLERIATTGKHELVAYVVHRHPMAAHKLAQYMAVRYPEHICPAAYVPVSYIPRLRSGAVDESTLGSVEVLDQDLLAHLKEVLPTLKGMGRATLAVEERKERTAVVHLSEFVEDWRAIDQNDRAQTLVRRANSSAPSGDGGAPAISKGAPVVIEPGAPVVLGQVIERAARLFSAQDIVYLDGSDSTHTQTYAALLIDARCIFAGLRQVGVKPGDKVILQLRRNADFIAAFWACALGGFVAVPLGVAKSFSQAGAESSKLANAWRMLGAPIILTSTETRGAIAPLAGELGLDRARFESVDDLRRLPAASDQHVGSPDDVALLLLTSGSTGKPKAVAQTHRALLTRTAATIQHNHHSKDDVSFNWMPLDHVGGLVMYHLRDVYLGRRQVQAPTEWILADPLRWLEAIDRYRVADTWAPNFAFALVTDRVNELATRSLNLNSLRFILNGGEAIVPKTARRFLELLAPMGLRGNCMFPAWGMSETCSGVTYAPDFSLESTRDDDVFTDLGLPIPGFSMRVVDGSGRIVHGGETGHLEVRGPSVTGGYYENPEQNAESFTADGWFRTGDLALLRGGRMTITGRAKDVIIVNGINYYSHEIEKIGDEVDGVEVSFTAACAVRAPGSDTDQLAVFFVPRTADDGALLGLIEKVRRRVIERIGLNPSYIVPVTRETVPKTSVGKIQRALLAQQLVDGVFDPILRRLDILAVNENTVPNWFYRRAWQRKPSRRLSRGHERILLFIGDLGLGDKVAELLRGAGSACTVVEPGDAFAFVAPGRYRVNPTAIADYRALIRVLGAESDNEGVPLNRVVHMWACDTRSAPVTTGSELEAAQRLGLSSLALLLRVLAERNAKDQPLRLDVIAKGAEVVTVDGEPSPKGVPSCEHATLVGFLRSALLELAWLRCQLTDLEGNDLNADASHALAEIAGSASDTEVAYRAGGRLVPRLASVDLRANAAVPAPFDPGGVYLITGALGGLGGALARFLATTYRAKLILIGRTALPDRAAWAEISRLDAPMAAKVRICMDLEARGADFTYHVVDVCDADALAAAIAAGESKWGRRLSGAFHLAGIGTLTEHWKVAEERRISVQTDETIAAILRPKVLGTWTLYHVLRGRPDALMVGFSSTNGTFGGATLSAYSAANSFVDACVAARRLSTHPRSHCFAWSMWRNLGMSRNNPAAMTSAARALGFAEMNSDQGIAALRVGLSRGEPHLLVGLDAAKPYVRKHIACSDVRSLHLVAYSNAESAAASRALESLAIVDRYGVRVPCEAIKLDDLPLTSSGELDRERLPDAQNPPRWQCVQPNGRTEEEIARIWSNVLHVDSIGASDSFFELGGDSLKAGQIIHSINRSFDIAISISQLFEAHTVARLAAIVEQELRPAETQQTPPLAAAATDVSIPLSSVQSSLWLSSRLGRSSLEVDLAPIAFRIEGPLDLVALRNTLSAIVARQASLRTIFPVIDDAPRQQVIASLPWSAWFTVYDLRALDEGEIALQESIADGIRQPFDLERGPLFRVALYRVSESEHLLFINASHLILDGWSYHVFIQELSASYDAFSKGERPTLPDLPVSPADYAVWEGEWRRGEHLHPHLRFWKSQLAGTVPDMTLRTLGNPRPPHSAAPAHADQHDALPRRRPARTELSGTVFRALESIGGEEACTPFIVLLAAYQLLLSRCTGEKDIWAGVTCANRESKEIAGLMGSFSDAVVVRTRMGTLSTFRGLVRQVRKGLVDAFDHRQLRYHEILQISHLRSARNRMARIPFINFDDAWVSEFWAGELRFTTVDLDDIVFDAGPNPMLVLAVRKKQSGYALTLFPGATSNSPYEAADVLQTFLDLLDDVVMHPDAPFDQPNVVRGSTLTAVNP